MTTASRSSRRHGSLQSRRMDDEGPDAPIQSPPARLEEPNISVLASGTVVHRVHAPGFAGNDFNPCRGGPSRFAPIQNADGECVPSLYAATSTQAAIFETLFRDIPLEARRKTIPRSSVEARQHTVLQLRRDLRLASLRAPSLLKWQVASTLVWGPAYAICRIGALGQGHSRSVRGCGGLDLDIATMRPGLSDAVLRWAHD